MLKNAIPILIMTVLALCLIILKVNPSFIHNIGSKKASQNVKATQANQIMTSDHAKHRDFTREATFPFENKEREKFAKKYPKKFAIVKKMFYSWDYIHNAQGEYEWGQSNSEMNKGKFYVDLDNNKNLVKSQVISNGKVVEKENFLLNNKVGWRELPNKKIYSKEKMEDNRKGSAEANELGYLQIGNTIITESEWYALIYNDYPKWSYKVETKNNIPVYKIKGTITKQVSTNLGDRFTMTVAKDTGALLDLKCYGDGDKPIFFVTGKDIKINKGIKNSVFQLDVSKDKKLPFDAFNSQTYGAQADTSKTGGVSQ